MHISGLEPILRCVEHSPANQLLEEGCSARITASGDLIECGGGERNSPLIEPQEPAPVPLVWRGDLDGQVDATRTLGERFFEDILVNAEDESVLAARQGLLASLLAAAPAGIDWKALDIALG